MIDPDFHERIADTTALGNSQAIIPEKSGRFRLSRTGEKIVKDTRRATRRQFLSEEKIRIVLNGMRGEDSIAELCRREGISQGISNPGACLQRNGGQRRAESAAGQWS